MEIISPKLLILITLATSSLLTSNILCADELMFQLHSKENYDKYSEPREIPNGEKERSLNSKFQELKEWGPKNIIKMSTPTAKKMPYSAANLPLRFGRTLKEERSPAAANLPLRFGRNRQANILRCIPNLPQRFGRMTTAKSITMTLSDLLQGSVHSLPASKFLYSMTCQHQEIQNPDKEQPRKLAFKEIYDAKEKQEKVGNLEPVPQDDMKLWRVIQK